MYKSHTWGEGGLSQPSARPGKIWRWPVRVRSLIGSMCSGPVPPQPFPPSSRRPGAVRGRGLQYVSQALSPEMMNAEVKAEKQERKWSPPCHLTSPDRGKG